MAVSPALQLAIAPDFWSFWINEGERLTVVEKEGVTRDVKTLLMFPRPGNNICLRAVFTQIFVLTLLGYVHCSI